MMHGWKLELLAWAALVLCTGCTDPDTEEDDATTSAIQTATPPPQTTPTPAEEDTTAPQEETATAQPGFCQERALEPWSRKRLRAGGTVVFTEIMYHPTEPGGTSWIEIHNPFSIDMDISGWRLEGAVSFLFPEGTFLSPGSYRVIAPDPASLEADGVSEVLGPWKGSLPTTGGSLELYNNAERLMDSLTYSPAAPWPVAAAGSGASLAKWTPVASSELAEAWRGSLSPQGTPGKANFADPLAPPSWSTLVTEDAVWHYEASGKPLPAGWSAPTFDDEGWSSGAATFYAGAPPVVSAQVTAHFSADNFFALYAGQADGSDLHLIGRDGVGDWTSAEDFSFVADPAEHLFVAAWDSGGPQMVIGEVYLPEGEVLTEAETFEWTLGPSQAIPGYSLEEPPPSEGAVQAVIRLADALDDWDSPQAEADKSAGPWGGALAGAFASTPQYVWSDTFGDTSQADLEQTYVLFRSARPLLPTAGATELSGTTVTRYFRQELAFSGNPAQTTLWLSTLVGDGAIFYLNGQEVLRLNMPEGPVSASTYASSPVEAPELSTGHALPSDLLIDGTNVLAVEVHQSSNTDGTMVFNAVLQAETREAQASSPYSSLFLSEVPAGGSAFWVELFNAGDTSLELAGVELARAEGGSSTLSSRSLAPGGSVLLDRTSLGFEAAPGDRLFLYGPDRGLVLDGVTISEVPQARAEGSGDWFFPDRSTPGTPNGLPSLPSVVINELMYRHAPLISADGSAKSSSEEWVELLNAGSSPVDLGGWTLVDGIEFQFPPETLLGAGSYLVVARDAEALREAFPEARIIGDFDGKLDNSSERLVLRDTCGNVVDEVEYADGGRWPEWADGGGSSLELRDPRADNGIPEAWAGSFEPGSDGWQTVVQDGVVEPSVVGPDGVWQELVLGLLDAGEVLIDDVSLVEDPVGAKLERIQNGDFERGVAEGWRLLGNHRHSSVVVDPTNDRNHALLLTATGPTEHMHNHAETTLKEGAIIQNGVRYRLSFRARWVAGSNLVNSRLYFNRLARTTLLERPTRNGTPGAPNSVLAENIGPTYAGLSHWPAVPWPGEPVQVSVRATDPDGIASLALWYSLDGAAPQKAAMTAQGEGFVGLLPGSPAGTIVQLWVEGVDGQGVSSTFPARGAESRALFKVADGDTVSSSLPSLQIIVTPEDDAWLFAPENLMSNDLVGATVIWNGREVFYDVGVRLKGSERGRPETVRVGFSIQFHRAQLFRGVYSSVMVDRSEGVNFGQREMLINLMIAHAGSVYSQYGDLIQVLAPRAEHTGPAELQLTGFGDPLLDFQFENGGDGQVYEYEYIYYPLTTVDGSPESPKVPQPDSVVGTGIHDLGDDQEAYRYVFMLKNNRWQDDYEPLIRFAQAFGTQGSDFASQMADVIDVDQWLRSFAFASLAAAVDNYGVGDGHNADFYWRPSDQRMLYFTHDLDFFGGWAEGPVVSSPDLARLIASPAASRSFYGQLLEIVESSYNLAYMSHWCAQLGRLLPDQDFAGHCAFMDARSSWVLDGASDSVYQAIPEVPFQVTTQAGADFSTQAQQISLEGQGWVDVRSIWREGAADALAVSWMDETHWLVNISLNCGANTVALTAFDSQGQVVGTDEVVVTREGSGCS